MAYVTVHLADGHAPVTLHSGWVLSTAADVGIADLASTDQDLLTAGAIVLGGIPAQPVDSGNVSDASTTVKGITKMSVTPISPTSPIAVGDNDLRLAIDSAAATGSLRTLGTGASQAAQGSVATAHQAATNNPHAVTQSQVGLTNVTDTSDVNKPVSMAQQAALDLKAQALNATTVKTSAYTAASGDYIPVDTTAGAVTITLPTAPANNARIGIKLVIQGSANAVTITRGGTDVFNKTGGSTSLSLVLTNEAMLVQYNAATGIWYVQADNTPLSQLDARYTAADTELAAIAGLASAADRLAYFTGSGSAALATFTTFARTLLDDTDATTALATLGALGLAVVDAKGDLLTGTADNTVVRHAVGTDGMSLVADALQTNGLRWTYPRMTLQQRLAMPTGALSEGGFGRSIPLSSQALLTSGTLRLGSQMVLPKNRAVTAITIMGGSTAAVTPTNQWFALVRVSDLAVLGKTADDLTAAWGVSVNKTLTLTATYTPTDDELVWAAILVVAGTVPTIVGWSVNATVTGVVPVLGGNSTTGLTTPASLGGTALTPATGSALNHYGYVT